MRPSRRGAGASGPGGAPTGAPEAPGTRNRPTRPSPAPGPRQEPAIPCDLRLACQRSLAVDTDRIRGTRGGAGGSPGGAWGEQHPSRRSSSPSPSPLPAEEVPRTFLEVHLGLRGTRAGWGRAGLRTELVVVEAGVGPGELGLGGVAVGRPGHRRPHRVCHRPRPPPRARPGVRPTPKPSQGGWRPPAPALVCEGFNYNTKPGSRG